MKKKFTAIILTLMVMLTIIPFGGTLSASAATSSSIYSSLSGKLPMVTHATPLSGASKVYPYTSSSLSTKQTGYWIDTFVDQIVITQMSSDGRAVYVTYPSSSSSTGYRSLWFATDDILGISTISISQYTASSSSTTYCLSSASGVKSYGSIAAKDGCVKLGSRAVGGKTYYPTIYPISSQTINKVSGVRYKLALATTAGSSTSNPTPTPANSSVTSKMDALISGTAYLHYNGSTHQAKNGTKWDNWYSSVWGSQCKGFATAVFYELYGYNIAASYQSSARHVLNINSSKTSVVFSIYRPAKSTLTSKLQTAKPGDYIQMSKSTSQHSMIVYSVTSTGLWVYDANSDGANTIKKQFRSWDYFYDYMGSSSYGISLYRAK